MTPPPPDYDVIVVGARVAGASTALLLARRGQRVLLVDRARFPSDTVSSHQVQVPGTAALHRWGLLEAVVADAHCVVDRLSLTVGDVTVSGVLPTLGGVSLLTSPRRTRLDQLLVSAAEAAGAEVQTRFTLEDVLVESGRVAGVRGRSAAGIRSTLRSRLVVGADGKNSTLARLVGAPTLRSSPKATVALYTYWQGFPVSEAALFHLPGRAVAVFPTDDDQTVTYLAAPADELDVARRDPAGFMRDTLDRCGWVRAAARGAQRTERIRLTPDVPHVIRLPWGPGWALAGDAGMVMDPVSAQGISNALLSAEMLVDAILAGLEEDDRTDDRIDDRLGRYHRQRDAAFTGMFDFTRSLTRLAPRPDAETVLRSIAGDQGQIDRLLSVFSGVEPAGPYLGPRNMLRVLGWSGLASLARARLGQVPERRAAPGSSVRAAESPR